MSPTRILPVLRNFYTRTYIPGGTDIYYRNGNKKVVLSSFEDGAIEDPEYYERTTQHIESIPVYKTREDR
jgi:hypothetical protein